MIGLCIEHTALLAGRDVKNGNISAPPLPTAPVVQNDDQKLQQMTITYPGRYLSASKLASLSKFRRDGGKQRVLLILNALENKNLGKIQEGKTI